MKTHATLTQNTHFKALTLFSMLIIAMLAFSSAYAQQTTDSARTIKGLVTSSDEGPLDSVTIIQKDTTNGTTTNAKGEFTFPVKLNTGDVLTFTYLGYETQNITITDSTSFITLTLTPDLVEIMGSLDANVPYKSKRKN